MFDAVVSFFRNDSIGFNVILGGFALFLLGINFLGDGLKEITGNKIRDYIEKYTSNIFMAILVGTVITGIMQSSTAVTIISISLVRAGLMKLKQAIGISIGANLGTTVTSLIIGLNIEYFGYFFLFFGALMMVFAVRSKYIEIGRVLFGFGAIFVGLQLMSDRLILLQDTDAFHNFMDLMSRNPWLALFGGTVATAIINSSTAVIGLVQKLYEADGMNMVVASAFVFGSNVGTTLTAILASIGGSVSTKRAGWFHAIYNIAGALLAMLVIVPYSNFIEWLNARLNMSATFSVGLNHFIFNLASTVLVIFFIPGFIKLLEFIIPGDDNIKSRQRVEPLDESLIVKYPEGALQLAKKATIQMADLTLEAAQTSQKYLHSGDKEDFDIVMSLEELVNELDTQLTAYLLKIARSHPGGEDIAEQFTKQLEIVKNYERISDLATNLVEFYALMFDVKESFTTDALSDLDQMYELLIGSIQKSLEVFSLEDASGYDIVLDEEEKMDALEVTSRERHFDRMAREVCQTKVASSIFVDVLGIIERMADHSMNVARITFNVVKYHD